MRMGFWTAIIGFTFLACWTGGVAEAFGVGRSEGELAKAVGWTTDAALLGMLGFFVLLRTTNLGHWMSRNYKIYSGACLSASRHVIA
eukprot:SAG31_NODE_13593_length_859_cov_0.856579_2_plen_86_part_01